MRDDRIILQTPDLRISLIADGNIGAADYLDARGDSRSTWREWEKWEEFARQILAVRNVVA